MVPGDIEMSLEESRLATTSGVSIFCVLTVLLLAVVTVGCSGGGGDTGPTAPESQEFVLSNAVVSVNGDAVNGQTLPQGHGDGGSTRFEAEMMSDGSREPDATVWMQYDRPMGMNMMRHTGRIEMYDDGTHGDRVAGDALYGFEDFAGEYGCHSASANMGEYRYEFYGFHDDGHESNHMTVTVNITDN